MSLLTFAKNGQQQTYTPSFESIAQLLGEHARKFPGKEALIGINVDTAGQYSISYEKLQEMAMQTANFLFGKGIRKGDRIAFLFHNTPEILILELAAGFIGASSVPLDSKRDTTERKIFKLKDANVKILFSSVDEQNEEEAARIAKTLPSLGSVVLTNENPLWQRVGDQPVAPDFAMNDSVESEYVLLYTSGTTANPKGVPLTLRACFANAEGICQWQKLSSEDRFLIVLPLHHVNSTIMSLATLVAGGTIILSSRYSASKFWDIVENRRATITSVVPTILHDLLARKEEFFVKSRDLSSLKRILVGSAPVLPKETMRFMETFGVNVVQGYGQTETALRVTGVPINLSRESHLELTKKNSIGKELAFCNVAILRHDGSQADENEEGEICIRGPVLGDGYLNNPEETDKTFSQGWFHSGDLGFYQMVNGDTYFFIKGRIKEIIIKGGIKISPAAVEDALLKNFPEIDEVCVVGYSDARMGEEVAALIRLDQNSRKEQERETKRRILEDGGLGKLDGLSRYECPTKVFILKEEIPKTYTGKIQRVKAKEMIAEWVRHEEAAHYYCRLIQATEARALQQAVEINNQRWGLPSSAQEFEVRARNGYVIGVFDEHERLRGTLSALRMFSRKCTWQSCTTHCE